jgi:hypothetical protein
VKSSKIILYVVGSLIGLGLFNASLSLSKVEGIFFLLWVVVFPFLTWVLPILGRRLFPIRRYYPFRVSSALLLIAASLDYWLFIKVMPTGYEWLSVIFLAIAFAAISTFFPIKQKEKSKKD